MPNPVPTSPGYSKQQRPLADREVRRIRKRIRAFEKVIREAPKNGLGCLAGLSLPCIVVFAIKPHDPVNRWGSLVLFAVFAVIIAATCFFNVREWRQMIQRIARTIDHGTIQEHRVVSTRCFKVYDDDGEYDDIFFFDVGESGTLVLSDYDLETRRFPNSDFTAVYTFNERGKREDFYIRCEGKAMTLIEEISRGEAKKFLDCDAIELIPIPFDEVLYQVVNG